jgi:hypothetical protein
VCGKEREREREKKEERRECLGKAITFKGKSPSDLFSPIQS